MNSFTQNETADLSDPNGQPRVRTGKGEGYEYNYAFTIHLSFLFSSSYTSSQDFSPSKKTSFKSRSKENKNNPRLFPGCVGIENVKPGPVITTNNTKEEEEEEITKIIPPSSIASILSFSMDGRRS